MAKRSIPRRPAAPREAPRAAPRSLILDNIRCFARAEIPLDAKVTVIIGQNGSGKTTLAEAIASLAPGEREGLDELPRRRGGDSGSIAIAGANGKPIARWTDGPRGASRTRLPPGNHVFVYGQYRALRPPPNRTRRPALAGPLVSGDFARPAPAKLEDAERRSIAGTLFDFDEYLFRDLGAYVGLLAERASYDPAAEVAWESLRDWLAKLDERIGAVRIETRGRVPFPVFDRAGLDLDLSDLSDGYRAVLSVALDLVIRYVQRFGALEDPLKGEAWVVIDEIDLNLHPRWQRKVIRQLTDLFPETHFILTTHSPTVVQAAIDRRDTILLLDDKHGRPTEVRPLKPADLRRLDGAEVDAVLVDKSAFRVASRYSLKYEALETEATKLREKVASGEATARDERRLIKVLDHLHGLVVKAEKHASTGPLLSEIAETHIALLESMLAEKNKKGAKAGGARKAKRRQGAR